MLVVLCDGRQLGPQGEENPAVNLAAVVNGEAISRQALAKLCIGRWGEETLESLVNKQLITEACQAQGIVISNQDIEAEIQSISSKFGMSIDQYMKMLETERDVSGSEWTASWAVRMPSSVMQR